MAHCLRQAGAAAQVSPDPGARALRRRTMRGADGPKASCDFALNRMTALDRLAVLQHCLRRPA